MGLPDVNNDIKILFFIVNSLIGAVPGIFLFGVGVSTGVVYSYQAGIAAVLAVVGLVIIGLAALGFAGAIRENRIMLYVWSAIMALIAIANVIVYAVVSPSSKEAYLQVNNQWNQYDQSGRRQDRTFENYRRAQEYANTQMTWLASTITYFVLVFVGVALAIKLALQARNQVNNQGVVFRPPPTSYSPGV